MQQQGATMGHDVVTYEEHGEVFNDFDLWTLRYFFIEQAQVMERDMPSDNTRKLREFFERWDWMCPGVVTGIDFSLYVQGQRSRWHLLLQLLQATGDRLCLFGELIPIEFLNPRVSKDGAHFTKPQPVRDYLKSVGRMSTLLSKAEPSIG